MSEKEFDITNTNPSYARNVARWQAAQDFYHGGVDVHQPDDATSRRFYKVYPSTNDVDHSVTYNTKEFSRDCNSYIHGFKRERYADFIDRSARLTHIPITQWMLDILINSAFKSPAKRDGKQSILELETEMGDILRNVDLNGTGVNEHIRRVSTYGCLNGRCHSIVDIDDETGAPYIKIITATELIDWSLDELGRFNWIVFLDTPLDDRTPGTKYDKSLKYYRVITKDEWALFAVSDGEQQEQIDGGINKFGFVPIATYKYKKAKDYVRWLNCDPIMDSLLDFDLAILNKLSLLDQIDYNQTFSLLAIPTDNPHNLPGQYDVGVNNAIACTTGSTPSYISPDARVAAGLWQRIQDLINVARSAPMAGRGAQEQSKDQRSGVGMSIGMTDKWAALNSIVDAALEYERELQFILSAMSGAETTTVEYGRKFDVLSLESKINNTMKMSKIIPDLEVMKPIIKPVVEDIMRNFGANDAEITEAINAVDNAEEQVEEVAQEVQIREETSGDAQRVV